MPACVDFTCPWWSAPQMSMRWLEPRAILSRWYARSLQQIRGGTVGLHEHAVARVAEVGGAQPARAVLLVDDTLLVEHAQHVGDLVALVQRPLGEPGVEVHADAVEIGLEALDDVAHAPLARVVGRHVVAELGAQLARQVDEILALVPVFGRLLASVARVQRVAERRELVPGVVEVVLAVHLRALRRQQVRDRVADRDPAAAARVQRAGGVGRDELEIDPLAGQRLRGAVAPAPTPRPCGARRAARWARDRG